MAGLHGVTEESELPATEEVFGFVLEKGRFFSASEESESHSTTTTLVVFEEKLLRVAPRAQVAAFCPVEANASEKKSKAEG